MDFWSLRVDVLPKGDRMPILSHVFFSNTRDGARDCLIGHLGDDAFLSSAYHSGQVAGIPMDVTIRYTHHKKDK